MKHIYIYTYIDIYIHKYKYVYIYEYYCYMETYMESTESYWKDPEDTVQAVNVCLALDATQGQIRGFLSQLSYKCHQNRVAFVGD